ncbi:hypothetical protein RvY_08269 [Ramazzottius varieornatus]|uniref:BAR domain-containing protein n=1 Tax=Ramazzottius varieornatus TaxID=947166 RepID=A0A1D1VEF5_RAMVA|nr:hypothetical protein RvY_08269 [Ramazzottius varieornatus]
MNPSPVEYQCKLVNGRVENVGKHANYFSQGFTAYTRKVAGVRDKGDDLVDLLTSFANHEAHNSSSSRQLHEFAHWLAMVQDFRHHSTTRLSMRILPSFQTLSANATSLKSTVKKCTAAVDKTKKALETANNVKNKNGEHSAMYHLALDGHKASTRETSRQAEVLRVQAKEFEATKLEQMKKVLCDFAQSELMFHTRAVEMCTAAFRAAQAISVEEDLHQFVDVYEAMDDHQNSRNPEVAPTYTRTDHRRTSVVQNERRTVASLRASISQPALTSHLTNGHQEDERYDVVSQPLRFRGTSSNAHSSVALSSNPTGERNEHAQLEERPRPQPARAVARAQSDRQDSDESETDSE